MIFITNLKLYLFLSTFIHIIFFSFSVEAKCNYLFYKISLGTQGFMVYLAARGGGVASWLLLLYLQ